AHFFALGPVYHVLVRELLPELGAPVSQVENGRRKQPAGLGQAVLDPQGLFVVLPARDYIRLFQLTQLLSKHFMRYVPWYFALELAVAAYPRRRAPKIPYNKGLPLPVD